METLGITSEQRNGLEEVRRATRSKKEYVRLTAILDLADRMQAKTICQALRIDETTLWRWRARFENGGVHGLADDHYLPNHSFLTPAQ